MYTLDTNAIIYCLKDDKTATPIIKAVLGKSTPVYISSITELELFAYPDLSWREEELINYLLESLSIISLDSQLARMAGEIRSKFRLKVADSAIAATALFTGTTLLTRNVKDFKRVPNLKLQKI